MPRDQHRCRNKSAAPKKSKIVAICPDALRKATIASLSSRVSLAPFKAEVRADDGSPSNPLVAIAGTCGALELTAQLLMGRSNWNESEESVNRGEAMIKQIKSNGNLNLVLSCITVRALFFVSSAERHPYHIYRFNFRGVICE